VSKKSHVFTDASVSALARTHDAVMERHAASTLSPSAPRAITSGWMHILRRDDRHTPSPSALRAAAALAAAAASSLPLAAALAAAACSSLVRYASTRFSSSIALVISGTVRVQ